MKKKTLKTHFNISKKQLEGLLEYMKMYGVDTMKFKRKGFAESLENFGPKAVKVNGTPQGRRCCFFK